MSSSSPQVQLTADYHGPDGAHRIAKDLPQTPAAAGSEEGSDVEAKTEYLSALRNNVVQLQADINTFLTQKMEEDKAAGADAQDGRKADEKEEEMYGEEDPEHDG
ncbi:uncharacterized protein K489DRAFT_371858 [Dissoconium aciculare CBS 342.82]|jgi:hypothetical protein|uniref:EKC/KEOPS complex subunit GON7 n=1 Tax=Dissoconium aciculare CBS 342.82 TaxID=1314786 RepID=A0A6J3M051_9PEZI|nr:uncharacterized protein K489DRAFT_371858 [Dissoconium aciculare CBS 342.82]KAF1820879.1 hypothetical protein K489DRAFT_371858 [Dissoconium aciculare CBS 342.82]